MNQPQGMILIDAPAGRGCEFDRSFFERTGHEVAVCPGPADGELCPLLAGIGCEKLASAHGIVFVLDLDRDQHRAILQRYQEVVGADVPIRAVVRAGQREKYAAELASFELWEHEATVADLDGFAARVEAVDRSTS